VWNDDVRWKTEQPHLSTTVQARRLSLFGHTAQMPNESDAKQILTASPLENWRRPDVYVWHYALIVVHARNE